MTHFQLDYKVVTTIPVQPDGKQYGVQTLHVVDKGSSSLVAAEVREDFTAETTARVLFGEIFPKQGRPDVITMDRDTRLAGSPASAAISHRL